MVTSTPTSIVIPASPLDAQLLSASTAFLLPYQSNTSQSSHTASGSMRTQQEQHFITKRQFELWKGSHPGESLSLRPPVGSEGIDKMTLKGYRAPQHPTSHLLQSIPPRSASRSSRSNILSYTLHLATSSRLSSYSSENGTRTLLHWAEADQNAQETSYENVKIDSEWFETEQKTQGLWKLGINLLHSSRREGPLPPSVERRVVLACLAEELLLSPTGDRAMSKIDEESVHPSSDVAELTVLRPLTSPDTTTLYLSTSAHAANSRSPRDRSHSVAQSLIDMKFGGKPSELESPPLPSTDKSLGVESSSSVPGGSVFGDSSQIPTASTSELTATPHMDYRIVLSQSMRTRAKSIFATSPLPALTTSFCRRHRVATCTVCTTLITESSERVSDHAQHRRRNIPGAGLRSTVSDGGDGGTKKALVSLVPAFLKLSADLIADSKDATRVGSTTKEGGSLEKGKGKETETSVEIHVTSIWYNLLTSLLTQACLEGYLVDGWTGTEGIETLFGVGCGVWEGRGWSMATRAAPKAGTPPRKSSVAGKEDTAHRTSEGNDLDSDEDSEEEEENEEEIKAREREKQTMELVDAAHTLFGSRDVAQADYERGMRDRIHEFLNVPRDKNLIQHLTALSMRYPLSTFEDEMVDFLEASVRLLGKPTLAKIGNEAISSQANPDRFALVQYFSQSSPTTESTGRDTSIARDDNGTGGKRRRID